MKKLDKACNTKDATVKALPQCKTAAQILHEYHVNIGRKGGLAPRKLWGTKRQRRARALKAIRARWAKRVTR